MPVSCFNDSRMVGTNRCANSKAVGMSFLDRIWLKKFSTTSVKVATSLRKLVALFFLTCLAFLAFSFPFCVFCVFPCRWCRQRHSDDPLMTLIVMYFNNSLTIWNTEMNAIDKEKNLSNRSRMERARWSCKEQNMTRKAAKSSRVMHWTRQSNKMNNPNSSKMRRISVCLYWTLISHYWPLLIIIQ